MVALCCVRRSHDHKQRIDDMKRNGKTLRTLPDGAPRRLSDGRNAWRKMNDDQRRAFLAFIAADLTSTPKLRKVTT